MVSAMAEEAPTMAAREAASALAAMAHEPAALVTACRRLVQRQPTCGPLWWLGSRVLSAADPAQAAWRAVDELAADLVPARGTGAAAAGADLVLLEAEVAGRDGAVVPSGSRAAAAVGRHAGVPVWLVAGVGRVLPPLLWSAARAFVDRQDPWDQAQECVGADLVD